MPHVRCAVKATANAAVRNRQNPAILREMRIVLLVALASLASACAPNFSAARHQAWLDHHCDSAEAVWWDRSGGGVWVRACGDYRYYSSVGGRWVEDRDRARPVAMNEMPTTPGGCPIYGGLVQCGGGGGSVGSGGGGGTVHVRSYRRRDGTLVHSHTRSRPRRR